METPDEAGRAAIQAWLDSIDWTYDQARARQCTLCGFGFTPVGPATRCGHCATECAHDDLVLLGHTVAVNGARAPHKLCLFCGRLVSLRKGAGPGLYCFKDNRQLQPVHPCARCGSTDGSELHHWAPRAIFGFTEADRWPTSYLCRDCHTTWHNEMRRSGGVSLPPAERIDDLPELDYTQGVSA